MRLRYLTHSGFTAIVLIGVIAIAAAEKKREWQTGKVLDTERNRYFSGVDTDDGMAMYKTFATFVIETDKYVYKSEERLTWRWSKPAHVIVNTPVKFAVEKQKLYIVDDEGKEHETKIVKQVLKQ